jgi:sulfite reductase alpha subunit-like flavoprotein
MPTKEEIQNFSLMLREYAAHKNIGLWEALLLYCQTTGMESEVAASLLTKAVLADLSVEVQDMNLLKVRGKKAGRLPI